MSELKILIVEDNYEKVRVISDAIKEDESCHLEYCNNTKEALSKLKDNSYNILIVDMILPKCLGDHSEKNAGLELIERLYINTRLNQPDHLLAVTSHSDAFDTHRQRLFELGVPFLLADGEFNEVKKLLINKIKYCSNQNASNKKAGNTDVVQQLASPEKVTLKWLFHHVGISHWIWAFGLLIGAYCAGVQSSKLEVVKQVFKLETTKEPTSKDKKLHSTSEQVLPSKPQSNEKSNVSDIADKSAIRVKFTDGSAYVNFSYTTKISPKDAPKIVTTYGTREKAEQSLAKAVISELHSQMEKMTIKEARSTRSILESKIIKATEKNQKETFIKMVNLEIMAIEIGS